MKTAVKPRVVLRVNAFKMSVKKALVDPVIPLVVQVSSSALAAGGDHVIINRPPRCVAQAKMKIVMGMSMRVVVDVLKEKSAFVVQTVAKVVSVVLAGSLEDALLHDQDSLNFVVIRRTP